MLAFLSNWKMNIQHKKSKMDCSYKNLSMYGKILILLMYGKTLILAICYFRSNVILQRTPWLLPVHQPKMLDKTTKPWDNNKFCFSLTQCQTQHNLPLQRNGKEFLYSSPGMPLEELSSSCGGRLDWKYSSEDDPCR